MRLVLSARSRGPLVSAVALAALAGCSGSVEKQPFGPGSPGADGVTDPGASEPGRSSTRGPGTGAPSGPGAPGAGPAGPRALDPGRVRLRRLNRVEYCNTVADLLGTTLRPCDAFPVDASVHGFDTNGEVLTTSTLHVEGYEAAATALVDDLFAAPATRAERGAILSCGLQGQDGMGCARQILRAFARRAWRRPVAPAELAAHEALLATVTSRGQTLEEGLKLGLRAVLMSPHFLFRVEPDPPAGTTRRLDAHEVATRLSYALWSTMPDAELSALADEGRLLAPETLAAQVGRMIAHPKARGLAADFAGQWLGTRAMARHEVDKSIYKAFDEPLRKAAIEETQRFFLDLLANDRPVKDLLAADHTFLNDRLAAHYGLPAVGPEMKRVSLSGTNRRGILTQASVLTVTSHPDRTSAVRRGVWVLDQLLCSAVPPPPPEVDGFAGEASNPNLTVRERLAVHRAKSACAACHALVDPIGLGLENFDAVGLYRTHDEAGPIVAEGTLPDGRAFSGPTELAALLAADERFDACVTDRFVTYALGRTMDGADDREWLAQIAAAARKGGGGLRTLVTSALTSDLFLSRGAPVAEEKP